MLKNTNAAAVKKLGARSLKQNRTRNIFAMLAIILTTLMFTTVFGLGFSMGKNISIMLLRRQGTKTSITLAQPDETQIAQAKEAKYLHAAGIQIPAGMASDDAGEAAVRLDYYDRTEFEKNLTPAISDIQGVYPEKENEIMLSEAALNALQIKKPRLGMEISLVTESGKKKFTLSGWYRDYKYSFSAFQGLVSEEYVDALGKTIQGDGILCLSAKVGRQDLLLDEIYGLTLRKGQEIECSWDMQEESTDTTITIVCAIGLIGLIIILSGYLLIYNIMYISVSKDIRFYGMLKTIGTSPSQIQKIVKMQIARLAFVGVPIGIACGILLSFQAVPLAATILRIDGEGEMPSDVSFNPFIYVGTILFVIITVVVSCRKPAKLAGKVSAVEALKYTGQSRVKVKEKRTTDGGKLYKMAFRNIFREKKRAILVFASLFMGTMAFLSVDAFIGSMKLENYIEHYLPYDFQIHTGLGDEESTQEEINVETEQLAKEIGEIPGVNSVWLNGEVWAYPEFDADVFRPFLEDEYRDEKSLQEAIALYKKNAGDPDERYSAPVIVVNSGMIERYNERAEQKMDVERFRRGEICLMGDVSTEEKAQQMKGKQITLVGENKGKTYSMEVGACMTSAGAYGVEIGYYWLSAGGPSCIIISEEAAKQLGEQAMTDMIIANCEEKAEGSVKQRIKELTKVSTCVRSTQIKSDVAAGFSSSMMAMKVLGGGISIVLILIGIINFINVMLTGVYARRRELAVMESVGMTKRQIKRMLVCEGGYYAGITLLLLCTVGNGIIYVIGKMAQQIADYAVFHYPVLPVCIIAGLITVICILVPVLVYRTLSRESVTERLRSE